MTKRKPKSEHKPSGRRTVITPEVIGKLEYAFQLDCTVLEACFHAGISKDAYYDYIKKNPSITDRFEALKQNPVFVARETVVKSMKINPDIALKYLERKRKAEFSTRIENELSGGENENGTKKPLVIEVVTGNLE